MIEHIFLDFDGTIMVYDEGPGCFHPDVIELLNRLPELGVTWYSNSGRSVESQQEILSFCAKRGLTNGPSALLCGESFIFDRIGEEYVPCEPWNREIKRLLLAYHEKIHTRIKPLLKEWEVFLPADKMSIRPMATFFELEEGCENYVALADAFADAMADLHEGGVMKNGPWIFAQLKAINKGSILNHFMELHQIDRSTVLAVGDHENDYSMLNGSAAGHTGCPGNSIALIKQTVRYSGGYISEIDGPLGTLDVLNHYLSL